MDKLESDKTSSQDIAKFDNLLEFIVDKVNLKLVIYKLLEELHFIVQYFEEVSINNLNFFVF